MSDSLKDQLKAAQAEITVLKKADAKLRAVESSQAEKLKVAQAEIENKPGPRYFGRIKLNLPDECSWFGAQSVGEGVADGNPVT